MYIYSSLGLSTHVYVFCSLLSFVRGLSAAPNQLHPWALAQWHFLGREGGVRPGVSGLGLRARLPVRTKLQTLPLRKYIRCRAVRFGGGGGAGASRRWFRV